MHTHCTKQTVSQVTKKEKERKENFSLKLNWFAARTFASLSVWPIVFLFVCCLPSIEFLCVCVLWQMFSLLFLPKKKDKERRFCFVSVQCNFDAAGTVQLLEHQLSMHCLTKVSFFSFSLSLATMFCLLFFFLLLLLGWLSLVAREKAIWPGYLFRLFSSLFFFPSPLLYRSLINWPLNVCVQCRGWDHFSSSNVIYNISNRTPNLLTSGQKKLLPLLLLLLLLLLS